MLRADEEIRTSRLVLRAPREVDVLPDVQMIGDTGARGGPGKDGSRIKRWQSFLDGIGHWQMRGLGFLAITDRADGTIYGRCGLLPHDETGETQLAYTLFDGFEGRGIAFEAAVAVRRHAGKERNLPPLVSFVSPGNARSHQLAERLGATRVGYHEGAGDTLVFYRHVAWSTPLAQAQWHEVTL